MYNVLRTSVDGSRAYVLERPMSKQRAAEILDGICERYIAQTGTVGLEVIKDDNGLVSFKTSLFSYEIVEE